MRTIQCYNCRKYFEETNVTREHIPARTLFTGYDEKYRVNRITIPACQECNNSFSPTDEEFRNMIGIITKHKDANEITKKSVKSILRKNSSQSRLQFDETGKVSGVTFSEVPIEEFHKKNIKGLFYHEYETVLPQEYELLVNIDENDWSEGVLSVIGYLTNNFTWKVSGHEDIFRYILQPFRENLQNNDKSDILPVGNEPFYLCLMEYNKTHIAMDPGQRKNRST